jgi:Glycosyl hydrolase family 59
LSWGVPNWIGNGSYFTQENIDYQIEFAKCAQKAMNGDALDYIGVWNERSYVFMFSNRKKNIYYK